MQHSSDEYSLRELLKFVVSGELALPEFQRNFVWDPTRVTELLDSVSHGWPIGSLLILEGPQPFGVKRFSAGPTLSPESARLYLLDGQQRITALYHALSDTSKTVYFVDLAEETYGEPVPPFRWAKRESYEARVANSSPAAFKVIELVDDELFEQRTLRLSSGMAKQLNEERKRRMGSLLGSQYRLPATVMKRDIDLEALTRIFETLNRTGVKLDAFDLMVAVLYPTGFHLRGEWRDAIAENPILEEWDVAGLEVLKYIALSHWADTRLGAPTRPSSKRVLGVRQRDVLNTPPDLIRTRWTEAVQRYVQALEFVQTEGGVRDAKSLPSIAMVLTLSFMLDHHVAGPSVRRWYWSSIARQTYAQGANTQVTRDVDDFLTGELLASSQVSADDLASSLMDDIRRNRILRLGMRGLAVRDGIPDPLTGRKMTGPMTDFSLSSLRDRSVGTPSRTPLVDLVVCEKESLRELRRRVRRSSWDVLDPALLEQQHIPGQWLISEPDDFSRRERAYALAEWIQS